MSRAEIEGLLPHRAPFLLVDRVVAAGDGWIETVWTVPAGADWVRGHYPARPVTPGVLLCEHAFQSGALLVARAQPVCAQPDDVPVLTRIEDARFRRIVVPGETVETRVELVDRTGPACRMKAEVRCGGARAVLVAFTVASTGGLRALGV